MREITLAAAAAAVSFAAGIVLAHSDAPHTVPGGKAALAAPAGEGGAGTRDPRSYFTDLELLTQDGRKVRFYSDMLDGRTVLIDVIYTICQDACPLITQRLNEVRDRIPDLFGKDVFFVSLSSDPLRDTPQALKRFARKQGADVSGWSFLTGRKANIDRILKRLGQFSEDVEARSTRLIAGKVPHKRWSKIRPDAPPAAIAERLRVMAASPAAGAGRADWARA